MSLMIPMIVKSDDFSLVENDHGESFVIPNDVLDVYLESDFRLEENLSGYFWRLSAPGYLDSTEWAGPFNDEREALRDCYESHYNYDDRDPEWFDFVRDNASEDLFHSLYDVSQLED